MKRDIEKFRALQTQVVGVLVAKESTGNKFNEQVIKNAYPLLVDTNGDVANAYAQDVKLIGRMPSLLVIGTDQKVAYVHYGTSMKDIPANDSVLEFLAGKTPGV